MARRGVVPYKKETFKKKKKNKQTNQYQSQTMDLITPLTRMRQTHTPASQRCPYVISFFCRQSPQSPLELRSVLNVGQSLCRIENCRFFLEYFLLITFQAGCVCFIPCFPPPSSSQKGTSFHPYAANESTAQQCTEKLRTFSYPLALGVRSISVSTVTNGRDNRGGTFPVLSRVMGCMLHTVVVSAPSPIAP